MSGPRPRLARLITSGSLSAWERPVRALGARRSVILCYHGVAAVSPGQDPGFKCVAPDRFRAQLELLGGAGFRFVTVAEFARAMRTATPPPGLAALSFDDGMDNNHSVLLPILREYGVPATIYVTTGLVGKSNPFMPPASGARMMTEEELIELVEAKLELGAHTVTHPDLSQLDYESCLQEMVASRDALERVTGSEVSTFAYPYCRYSDEAIAAAREAGFIAAVTCQGLGSWASYELKRVLITRKDGHASFVLKLADAYQPLFESAPGRLLRVTTRAARREARRLTERGP
jgi:peptidoglycan/xylan/chitin deacetylase (PgdA/CDA1 family)